MKIKVLGFMGLAGLVFMSAAFMADSRSEIIARSEALVAAEAAGDWEKTVSFFAPDAVMQPANASQLKGREAILELYKNFPPFSEFESRWTDIVPSSSGDMAYEHGINRVVFDSPAGPVEDMGKYLVVWKKLDGKWMVAAIAFSSDAPPAQ